MRTPPDLAGKLIVSCQALADEPLHGSAIMAKMALAAEQGGAGGIRANTVADIQAIQAQVDLPIIALVKQNYLNSEVFITPTMTEVDALMSTRPAIIAIDARDAPRPDGKSLAEFYAEIRQRYPGQLLMADCATFAEMQTADRLGFDYLAPTLCGYTSATRGERIETDDFALIRQAVARLDHPVIAEGNINTPEKAQRVLELGAHSVVVGSAITRPQWITAQFVAATQRDSHD